jgi:glycosyltransferase involved in cell wall biosynthesis
MALVRRKVPNARLYVAGGFTPAYREYGEMVRRYVRDIAADGYVHFLGLQGHGALLEAYRTSQVFLFPSHLEASPVALAEAMAAGLPSVVSDIGGTEHLIADGLTGYRVPGGDVEALAACTVRLLRDPIRCRRMGERARRFAVAHSSPELAARKTHDLYLALTGTKR